MTGSADVDAAIHGADMPKDPRLKSVIAGPEDGARQWYGRHAVVSVNHLICVTESLANAAPGLFDDTTRGFTVWTV